MAGPRARTAAVSLTSRGVTQWLGSTRLGGGGHLIMRVSYSFISNANTQAAADIKYTVTLFPGSVKGIRILSSQIQNLLTSSKQLPPASLLSQRGRSSLPMRLNCAP